MLRALLISILEEDYYNVDPGDYILLYMLSESLGPGALFAILAQAISHLILHQFNKSYFSANLHNGGGVYP